MTVHNNDGISKDTNNIHPVTRSNGGAPPNNTKRNAATPNSAQKKNEGAIALAGLFNGGDSNNDNEEDVVAKVEPPALEAITEVVTLSSTSNDASSFETTAAILASGSNNSSNNLKEDLEALTDKRKVGEISTETEQQDPLVKYVETECGIVPPPAIPPQHYQQQQLTAGGIVEEPRKKMRRSAANGGGTTAVVSTPQKVASILASQLPKTSVPPGVPMPRLPAVQLAGVPQQYLPPPPPSTMGKTSFEQLMQVSLSVCLSILFVGHHDRPSWHSCSHILLTQSTIYH